jgi:dTDP-4-dehydrorhamnose reductase
VTASRQKAEVGAVRFVQLDLNILPTIREVIQRVRPQLIINASAYTDVERAEEDQEAADRINHLAVGEIGKAAATLDVPVIHYSTDYVYQGFGANPQAESDPIGPASVYARTKLLGEQALVNSHAKHLIFRTSWIYSPEGKNFPRTILRFAQSKETLRVVNDQIGAPTSARAVARATAHVVSNYFEIMDCKSEVPFAYGTYNLACSGYCSWFDLANAVIELARKCGLQLAVKEIVPVPASEYPVKAKRPLNSRLDLSKFESTFFYKLPHWRAELEDLASELCKVVDATSI